MKLDGTTSWAVTSAVMTKESEVPSWFSFHCLLIKATRSATYTINETKLEQCSIRSLDVFLGRVN